MSVDPPSLGTSSKEPGRCEPKQLISAPPTGGHCKFKMNLQIQDKVAFAEFSTYENHPFFV